MLFNLGIGDRFNDSIFLGKIIMGMALLRRGSNFSKLNLTALVGFFVLN